MWKIFIIIVALPGRNEYASSTTSDSSPITTSATTIIATIPSPTITVTAAPTPAGSATTTSPTNTTVIDKTTLSSTVTTVPETPSKVVISDLTVQTDAAHPQRSVLNITWKSNVEHLHQYSYQMELKLSDSDVKGWMRVLVTQDCCNIVYYHTGKSRTAKIRLSVISTMENRPISEYVETGTILLPNFHRSRISLKADFEEETQLHIRWTTDCTSVEAELSNYTLAYRHINSTDWDYFEVMKDNKYYTVVPRKEPAEYIIQLFAIDSKNELHHSEPIHHRFEHRLPSNGSRNRLVLKRTGPKSVEVDAIFDEEFKSKPMRYNLTIHRRSAVMPRRMSYTTYEKKFPFTVELSEYFGMYLFTLEFQLLEKGARRVATETEAIFTAEGVPSKVTEAVVELSPVELDDRAIVEIKWSAPEKPNGVIRGYKVQWKLATSRYNLYEVELCERFVRLHAFYPNTTYQILISARTSKGYGPETKLRLTVGMPPDWIHHQEDTEPTTPATTVIHSPNRRKFVPKLREDIGPEYGISHARIFMFISSVMLCVIVLYMLKYLFFSMKSRRKVKTQPPKTENKRRKKAISGIQPSK